jgi:Rrf2 family protein
MKLTSQEEYGLRLLLQLGRRGPGTGLTLPELSRFEGLSQAHAGKLMRVLRTGGLVKAARGQAGGYSLARPADAITVGEALQVLGGRLFDAEFCDRHAGLSRACTHIGECSIRPVLRRLQDVVDQVMGQLTLQQLLGSERDVRSLAVSARAITLPVLPN